MRGERLMLFCGMLLGLSSKDAFVVHSTMGTVREMAGEICHLLLHGHSWSAIGNSPIPSVQTHCPKPRIFLCHTGGQPGVAQQKYATPEAAWAAAWKEGRRLVQKYKAELNQGTSDAGRAAVEAGIDAGGAASAVQPGKQEQIAAGLQIALLFLGIQYPADVGVTFFCH